MIIKGTAYTRIIIIIITRLLFTSYGLNSMVADNEGAVWLSGSSGLFAKLTIDKN